MSAHHAPSLRDTQFHPDLAEEGWQVGGKRVARFMYLAAVLDVFSRIVGWLMPGHLRAKLVLEAVDMAVGRGQPGRVIHHSDQGCQYTSLGFGGQCRKVQFKKKYTEIRTNLNCPPKRVNSTWLSSMAQKNWSVSPRMVCRSGLGRGDHMKVSNPSPVRKSRTG